MSLHHPVAGVTDLGSCRSWQGTTSDTREDMLMFLRRHCNAVVMTRQVNARHSTALVNVTT